MLELATHIVKTKAGHFDPAKFSDQYEDALKDLLQRKQSGAKIEHTKEREPANVINLMDALRRSVQGERQAPAAVRPKQAAAQPKKGASGSKASGRCCCRSRASGRARAGQEDQAEPRGPARRRRAPPAGNGQPIASD